MLGGRSRWLSNRNWFNCWHSHWFVIFLRYLVDANGYVSVLYGTNDLGGEWTKITSSADRAKFHFFKIKFE